MIQLSLLDPKAILFLEVEFEAPTSIQQTL